MKVPVANVYYMLLYAWSLIGRRDPVDATQEGYTELQDLFAHVLADTVTELVARGLDRGYLTRDEPVPGIRGQVMTSETFKRNLLARGQAHCRFDELEYDVLHNRILKATLRKLKDTRLDEKNRKRVLALLNKLDAVADVEVAAYDFRRVQLHRNNAEYEYALRLCELIHDNLMVDPRSGRTRFREYQESEQQTGRLFEQFVGAFYDRHHAGFTRAPIKDVPWSGSAFVTGDWARLPRMITDIVMENPERRIILDTKFYANSFGGSGRRRKVISEHLYQILAYLHNREAQSPGPPRHEGILVYPVARGPFAFEYTLLGHRVGVRSVDLDQPWPAIHDALISLLDPPPGWQPSTTAG